jgi:bifunctional NMN adenylyltransferase/nudix hydrolase
MIQEKYPDIDVYYVEDNPSDAVWSKSLDNQITKWLKPYQTAILYGSRDSFLPHYSGKFPTQELESTKYISGTEIRRRIANNFESTEQFRAGAIAASLNRYPICYGTVDVAILDRSKKKVLVGKKSTDLAYRFIGGFSDTKSQSYEDDARREVREETGVEIDNLTYIGSTLIDDWRYRKEQDKIKTMFFVADYIFGRPEAADDIALVEWITYDELLFDKQFIHEHGVLQDMLIKYLRLR